MPRKIKKHHTFFRLAIMSGARQGELLGLKWSDVIWEDKPDPHSEDVQQSGMVQAKDEGIEP